jgi:iron complex outermembrane receptor protein
MRLLTFTSAVKPVAIAVLICCASVWPKAAVAEEPKHSINLPAADLIASLDLLGRQSGIEFIYDADRLRGMHAPAVSGSLTPKEALRQLLQGTPFGLVERPSGAIVIVAPPEENQLNSDSSGQRPPENRLPQAGPSASISSGHRSAVQGSTSLDQIIVTGTNIRGAAPIGAALQIYTREDIDQSGSATLEQFARQMPENFAGLDTISNVNSNLGILPQGAASNVFNGAAFDLGGLGVGSTLTLLNGHRMAPAGFDGSFVDISQISLSAIDHLEVLEDGASAIYGSDAVAGVINIVTRRDFTGAETGLRYGTSTEGGAGEYTASQLLGHSWAGGNVLVDYEYHNQGGLDASERNWIPQPLGPYSLIPRSRRNGGFISIEQDIGNDTTLSGSLLYGDRDFKSQSVTGGNGAWQSSIGHAIASASILSIERRLGADWTVDVTGNYSEIRQTSNTGMVALPSGGDSGANDFLSNSKITEVDTRSSGSIASLPAGAARISLGSSYRTEVFDSSEATGAAATSTALRRDVASGYAELLVPVLGGALVLPGVRRLEFSAAYRYDHYQQFGSTSNSKLGWLWEPLAGLQMRGTYGTSYQAPFLSQLGSPITSSTLLIPDRNSPSGRADLLEVRGGNPALLSERSRTITVGLDAQPSNIPGLRTTATAFYIVASNRIQFQNIQSPAILSQPLLLPFLGGPSAAVVQSYFDSPGFEGDNAGLGPSGVVAIFDNRVANIYSTSESGIHFSAQYAVPTSYGQFIYSVAGTHFLSEQIRPAGCTPGFDVDNTIGEPTRWKLRGNVGWAKNGFASRISINYVNAYDNTLFTPYRTIGSWTTTDIYASYLTPPDESAILRNLKIALSVQNVWAQRPPNVDIPTGDLLPGQIIIPFDGANASPVGRLMSLQITKRW